MQTKIGGNVNRHDAQRCGRRKFLLIPHEDRTVFQMIESTWSSETLGSQSMITPLRTVLVKRPDEYFAVNDPAAWHYTSRPNLATAQQECDALVL